MLIASIHWHVFYFPVHMTFYWRSFLSAQADCRPTEAFHYVTLPYRALSRIDVSDGDHNTCDNHRPRQETSQHPRPPRPRPVSLSTAAAVVLSASIYAPGVASGAPYPSVCPIGPQARALVHPLVGLFRELMVAWEENQCDMPSLLKLR